MSVLDKFLDAIRLMMILTMMMNSSMMKIWKPLTRKNRNIVSLKNWMTMMMKMKKLNM